MPARWSVPTRSAGGRRGKPLPREEALRGHDHRHHPHDRAQARSDRGRSSARRPLPVTDEPRRQTQLATPDVVRSYKQLAHVERAHRSLKGADLQLRPIHHHREDRVRAHLFCACSPTTWNGTSDTPGRAALHRRAATTPADPVAPATRSPEAITRPTPTTPPPALAATPSKPCSASSPPTPATRSGIATTTRTPTNSPTRHHSKPARSNSPSTPSSHVVTTHPPASRQHPTPAGHSPTTSGGTSV